MLLAVLPPLARGLASLQPHPPRLTFFRFFKADVLPEPAEHVGYAILVVITLAAIGLLVPGLTRPLRRFRRLDVVALLAQAAVVTVVAIVWWPAFRDGAWRLNISLAVAGAAVALVGSDSVRRRAAPLFANVGRRLGGRTDSVLWFVLAVLLGVLMLKTAVFTDDTVWAAQFGTRYHIPYTLEELTAVAGGRTPGVDFYGQYVFVLGYLTEPVLKLFNDSLLAFTSLMAALSLVSLLALFSGFRRLTRSRATALAMFIPVIGLALFPSDVNGPNAETSGNYYALFPMRYLAPFVLFALVAWAVDRPSPRRTIVVGAAAGLGAINNPDFGLVAAIAALVGLALGSDGWRQIRVQVLTAGLAAVAAVVAVDLFVLIRSGSLLDPGVVTFFIGIFSSAGFLMLPVHPWDGLAIPVFMTYVAAAATAAILFRTRSAESDETARIERALLGFSALLGFGTYSYYIGRSHPLVLEGLFSVWAINLVLLARAVVRQSKVRAEVLLIAPAGLLAFHLALGVLAVQRQPLTASPPALSEEGPRTLSADDMTAYVKRCAPPDKNVVIAYPMGYRIARAAHVTNWMPYNDWRAIVTLQQRDELFRAMRRHGVRKIFIAPDQTFDPFAGVGMKLVAGSQVAPAATPDGSEYIGMRLTPGTPIPHGCGVEVTRAGA